MRRAIITYGVGGGLLVAALLVISAANAQPRGGPNNTRWLPITGTSWSFAVPPGWQNLQPPQPAQPTTLIVTSVGAPASARGHFPNVNLVVEAFAGGDGRVYGRAALAAVQQIATVLGSRAVPVGTRPGFEIEASWPSNQPPTRSLQRIAVTQGRAHILTCSDTVEHFARSAAICQRIMGSFRVR